MSGQYYTASKSRDAGRQYWTVTFRHPLRTDPKGNRGLKVRRGLGTADDEKAERLVEQLNDLLRNESYWSVSARTRAERRYHPTIVDAFYSGMEVAFSNPTELREAEIPLPTREDGYARALFVGTTGAGKTSLLRHLIGSDPEKDRFPSTSTGRTTTADIEVITTAGPFRAVVTFLGRSAVRSFVEECLGNAILAAWDDRSDAEVARHLLHHPDQTFRLSYTLGQWDADRQGDEDDGWSFEPGETGTVETSGEGIPSLAEKKAYGDTLREYVSTVQRLADAAAEELTHTLAVEHGELATEDAETVETWLVEQAEADAAYEELLDAITASILQRFEYLGEDELTRDTTGWPTTWRFSSDSREEFLNRVKWFSSNHAPRFGRLLTPLVQGMRVAGPFYPSSLTDAQPKLVLIDGQGLGHTADSASSVTTHVTSRFDSVDLILLVDSAQQPMQAASLAAIRAVAVGGHQEKLRIAFTHFDLVKGPNLKDARAKREHLTAAARNAITALRDEIGDALVRSIDRNLEARCFTLGGLDQPVEALPPKIKEQLVRLLALFKEAIEKRERVPVEPVYDPASLLFAIQNATKDFHARWGALLGLAPMDGVSKEHWSRVKALNRRIANGWNVEYDTLKPVADLYSRLAEEISRFLERPVRWDGVEATHPRLRDEAIDSVRRSVSKALHEVTLERLIQDHPSDWIQAFSHAGRGSTFVRAREIREIYEDAAPIPGVVVNDVTQQFLDYMRQLVHEAIRDGGGKLTTEPVVGVGRARGGQ